MTAQLPDPPADPSPDEPAPAAKPRRAPRKRPAASPRPKAPAVEPSEAPDDLVIPPRPPLPDTPPKPPEPEAGPSSEPEPEPEPDPEEPERSPEAGLGAEPEPEPDSESEPFDVLWEQPAADEDAPALALDHVRKSFGATDAVDDLSLTIPAGTFYGLVGPNGAGKTTVLSMIAGLLRPDAGSIRVRGVDIRAQEREAKQLIGVLPDRLRTFDRLTGRQLLVYAGLLRGLDSAVVDERVTALSRALDLDDSLGRVVSDYSAGMTKKLMLAAAMIHAPRLLVLDEPFEAVDPASSAAILDILRAYVRGGGTVVLSSHGMDLIERVCDRVAVIAAGRLLAEGAVDEVGGTGSLEERFVQLVGSAEIAEGLEWLHTFSD